MTEERGRKYDNGKPRLSLLPPAVLRLRMAAWCYALRELCVLATRARQCEHWEEMAQHLGPLAESEDILPVLDYGLAKYGMAHSWRCVPDAMDRYLDAMLRHALAAASGEDMDPESGLSHLAHLACNAAFLLEFLECGEVPPNSV